MPYRSPKSGSVVNPGKRKKLPKSKVSKKTQKKNRKKLAKAIVGAVNPFVGVPKGISKIYKIAKNKYKEGQ